MIVSHRFKIIFIKTHKTAGSSFETALGPLCGPDDIVTPMGLKEPEAYAKNFHGQSFLSSLYARSPFLRKLIARDSDLLESWYWEHMPASRVKAQLPAEIWERYHKICIERNPWDKVVSYYLWKKHGQGRQMPSFEDYVLKKSHRLPLDGRLYFDEKGNSLVDEVIEFRDFIADPAQLFERFDIPHKGALPREKAEARPDRRHYTDYYSEETKAKVAALFSNEIEYCGYEFEALKGQKLRPMSDMVKQAK